MPSQPLKPRDQKVRLIVRRELAKCAGVLEISCGPGGLLDALKEDGYTVRGTNYTAYRDAVPGVAVDAGVDLLQGLPYPDDSFDCVILLDVIEHLVNHDLALANLARVLKPGGLAIISSPNANNISSRLHYLFYGFLKTKRSFIGFDVPADKAYAFHNYPPHLPVFLYQCHSRGLEQTAMDAVGYKAKSVIAAVLLWPVIWPASWYKTHRLEKFLRRTPAAKQLWRTLGSFNGLCGESWVLLARKRGTQAPPEMTQSHMPAWYQGPSASQS